MLFGSGIAISTCLDKLEIYKLISDYFADVQSPSNFAIVISVVLILGIITEFINNTSLTVISIPIIAVMAFAFGFNPLVLSLISVMTISTSFILAIATPSNSLIFVHNSMNGSHLMRAGALLKIISLVTIIIFYYFGLFDVYKIDFQLIKAGKQALLDVNY